MGVEVMEMGLNAAGGLFCSCLLPIRALRLELG